MYIYTDIYIYTYMWMISDSYLVIYGLYLANKHSYIWLMWIISGSITIVRDHTWEYVSGYLDNHVFLLDDI